MQSKQIGHIVINDYKELCIQHPDTENGIRRDYRSGKVEIYYPSDDITPTLRTLNGPIVSNKVTATSTLTVLSMVSVVIT